MKPNHSQRRAGVTLIELLVVLAIMGAVLGTVGACLMSGIRVWDAAIQFQRGSAPLGIAMDTFSRDARNAVPCHQLPYGGSVEAIRIPSAIYVDATNEVRGLGYIEYRGDPSTRTLLRKRWLHGQAEPPVGAALLEGVRSVSFEYRDADAWRQNWTAVSNQPLAVRMTISLDTSTGGSRSYERIVVPWRASE